MDFSELYALYSDQLDAAFLDIDSVQSGMYGGEDARSAGSRHSIPGTAIYWWDSSRDDFWFVNTLGDDDTPNGAVELGEFNLTVWGDDTLNWARDIPLSHVEAIEVVGQRRPPQSSIPYPSPNPSGGSSPCSAPKSRRDWNTDAAAAATANDIDQFAASAHPDEDGINAREYGANLWELPDGSVVRGAITAGDYSFAEAHLAPGGRAGVTLDSTPPHPYAQWIGTIHSHGSGGHILSGYDYSIDDQGMLTAVRDYRAQQGWDPNDARVYIYANDIEYQTVTPIISVYDHRNRDAAIRGERGPQVSPFAAPCP